MLLNTNDSLTDLESKTKAKYDKNHIISMVYKTTKIQILPEYEIYKSIVGKIDKNNPFNEQIINDIKKLGIDLFCGIKIYPIYITLTDENYFYI